MPTINITTPTNPLANPNANPNAPQSNGQTPKPLGLDLHWSAKAQEAITDILSRYPADRSRSALIPLLYLAQREFGGWLSVDAMQLVADTLNLPYIRVYEVASFYTMFNLRPVGQHLVQVCTNCACLIRGSDQILGAAKEFMGVDGDTHAGLSTPDGLFTLMEVECLGACVDAPMMQVGTHYYTNLTREKTLEILQELKEKGASKHVDTPQSPIDPITGASYMGEVTQTGSLNKKER